MTIWNLGSINADFVYTVPHIPAPGETLASTSRQIFLGGKGANMSVAVARAGGDIRHIGAIGADGKWTVERLGNYGVDTTHIVQVDQDTAQAIIAVDRAGENTIILHPGANHAVPQTELTEALEKAVAGDWVVCQNETNLQVEALSAARELGLNVAYAAAPFSVDSVQAVLPFLDFLILNEVEAAQLKQGTGLSPDELPIKDVIVTLGSEGAVHYNISSGKTHIPALKVVPIDTTGAGDTFTGYVLAGLDGGDNIKSAMKLATKASALMVTRMGASDVIPTREEAEAFSA